MQIKKRFGIAASRFWATSVDIFVEVVMGFSSSKVVR
jgi:hypothetical protein